MVVGQARQEKFRETRYSEGGGGEVDIRLRSSRKSPSRQGDLK